MNRRDFLATAALTPILASVFERARAQTGGGRLFYVGTYTNNAAGSKGIYAWRFDAATGAVTSLGVAAETDSPAGWSSIRTSDFSTRRMNFRRQTPVGPPAR